MYIWLITVGEPLPGDHKTVRLHRTGLLSQRLLSQGHRVLWWSSTLDHTTKTLRSKNFQQIQISPQWKINLLSALVYKKNVSVRRLLNHYLIGCSFAHRASQETELPDLILCSFPTIELAHEAVKFGRKKQIPVVIDLRDMWPDIIMDVAPSFIRKLARWLLAPLFHKTTCALRDATALVGITSSFLNWGLSYAGRNVGEKDRVFPLAYSQTTPSTQDIKEAQVFWRNLGVEAKPNTFIACFFGTFRPQIETDVIIKAARVAAQKGLPWSFVLCGGGESLEACRKEATGLPSVIFPGWIHHAQIWTLMRLASVGLCPYQSTKDFSMSIPNKPIEYLSAGLPILSCLQGDLSQLLEERQCGITYQNGDVEDLVRKLEYFSNNTDHVMRMKSNATKVFEERFVAEKVYTDYVAYLEQLSKTH